MPTCSGASPDWLPRSDVWRYSARTSRPDPLYARNESTTEKPPVSEKFRPNRNPGRLAVAPPFRVIATSRL
eukprot:SAG22_NODE_1117_length_5518_cov_6.763610_7_plen_71_part_00